jgi:two-component system chemotaxis family response regulator WspR
LTDVPLSGWIGFEAAPISTSEDYTVMVMLVDDQPMIGEAVRRALAECVDINFHYCRAPEQALALAEQIKPTVILQDLVMPGVDGLSLVSAYRANPTTRDVPIIVLSSKEEALVKSQAFAAGANDYIVKLPDSIELIARIRHHSTSFTYQRQRDDAYRALRESQKQLVALNLELQRLSRVDGLTGLSNRRCLDEFLESEWLRAARDRSVLSVLMIDVDDFKKFNDAYGHLAGDEALKKVSSVLRLKLKRPADLAARYGGEEFSAILPQTPMSGARALGEEICSAVEQLAIEHGGASSGGACLTVSVGVAAMIPERTTTFSRLLEAADRALYAAKQSGKNRVATMPGEGDAPEACPTTEPRSA